VEKGSVATGLSRAQMTRLVRRWRKQRCMLLPLQRRLDEAVRLSALFRLEVDLPVPFDKLLHFRQTQSLQILHGDVHLPAAWGFPAALPLAKVFRLTLYWTILCIPSCRVGPDTKATRK